MLLAQEVVDSLNGVEHGERHLDKDGAPIAHSAIPQTGKFEGLERTAVFRLMGNEAGRLVDEVGQVERTALIVADGANQIHGVEVRSLLEHALLLGVVHVDLRTFENLQRDGAIGVVGQERAATGLADIAHHAADAHRAVELTPQVNSQLRVLQEFRLGVLAEQFFLYELQHLQ